MVIVTPELKNWLEQEIAYIKRYVFVKLPFQLRYVNYLFVSVALIRLILYLKKIFIKNVYMIFIKYDIAFPLVKAVMVKLADYLSQ